MPGSCALSFRCGGAGVHRLCALRSRGLSVEHADVLAAGPDNAGYRWLGCPTFRQLNSSSAQLSPAHFHREGDELVEALATMVVEAHVRVLLAPSSSPWIAIAAYFGGPGRMNNRRERRCYGRVDIAAQNS